MHLAAISTRRKWRARSLFFRHLFLHFIATAFLHMHSHLDVESFKICVEQCIGMRFDREQWRDLSVRAASLQVRGDLGLISCSCRLSGEPVQSRVVSLVSASARSRSVVHPHPCAQVC